MLPNLRPVRVHVRILLVTFLAVVLYCSLPRPQVQTRQHSRLHVTHAPKQAVPARLPEQAPMRVPDVPARPNSASEVDYKSKSIGKSKTSPALTVQHASQHSTISKKGTPSNIPSRTTTHPSHKPSSTKLSSPERVDGVVIMGRMSHEDTTWVAKELPEWQHAIYTVDANNTASNKYTVPMNRGKESMPYLTYIIDHYDSLPATLVFLHSHAGGYPQGWHIDAPEYSNAYTVRRLQRSFVQRQGYVNLRCRDEPGCPAEVQPFRDPPDLSESKKVERSMAAAWHEIFGNVTGMATVPVPEVIAVPCCAQFAVARWQVRRRPRDDYVRMRQWVMSTLNDDPGRIMEYLWHIVFGQEPVHCPEIERCYRDVFDLDFLTEVTW